MNFETTSELWLVLGLVLAMLEFLVPGLVSVFIGLGALTVAGAMYFGFAQDTASQFVLWFGTSLFYIFTLRLLVLKLFPQDVVRGVVNDDVMTNGTRVEVSEDIPPDGVGRIRYSDSSWPAKSQNKTLIFAGEIVTITGRDNITYLVLENTEKDL